MHPAFSILFFTTLAGAAQGLLVALALAMLAGVAMDASFVLQVVAVGEVLLIAGLGASFLHLGHKMRAWRAVLMWRTSWMSREVIVLPAFIGLIGIWWLSVWAGVSGPWAQALPLLVVIGALLLWYCTAMIYACLRFLQEWAHWLTVANFTLIGLSSGCVLACALAAWANQGALLQVLAPYATVATLFAGLSRWASLRRNAGLRATSTLQSATGISSPKLVQKSMGMSAGAFNTREFFHGASLTVVRNLRWAFCLGLFVLPLLLAGWALSSNATWPWILACLLQAPSLIAERWVFFAQAKHPQNLYYQTVG
jgi:sulfite dehydrogenase (quinone) subunit SoeC